MTLFCMLSAGSARQMATPWVATNPAAESQLRKVRALWPHPARGNSTGRRPKMVRDTVTSLVAVCVCETSCSFLTKLFSPQCFIIEGRNKMGMFPLPAPDQYINWDQFHSASEQ